MNLLLLVAYCIYKWSSKLDRSNVFKIVFNIAHNFEDIEIIVFGTPCINGWEKIHHQGSS